MTLPAASGKELFVILWAFELLLIWVSRSSRRPVARAGRLLGLVIPLAFVLLLRAWQALGVRTILDWDETYYFSIASTAAAKLGLYPFIDGYGRMRIMGGIGWAAYLYPLAFRLYGPSIAALRSVSLVASVVGLAGLWVLVRRWYGTGTAWMAVALTASLRLFLLSNTIRMDAATFAWVAWALCAAAAAWDHPKERWRHYWAGLVFGLGLEVHIDTAVTAIACCAVYVAPWIRDRFEARWPGLLLFIGGELTGLLVYLGANILPDREAFYRTAGLVRLDATLSYSAGTSSLLGSFLSPQILVAKELVRYRTLAHTIPPLEIVLVVGAIMVAAYRRTAADRIVLALIPGVIIAAAVVLDNAAPAYFIHVLPALAIPIAPALTLGVTGGRRVDVADLPTRALVVFATVACGLIGINQPAAIRSIAHPPSPSAADLALAERVHALVDHRCTIAGDGRLYVEYFGDYPFFISTRPTEVTYGMLYYSAPNADAYWVQKQPDVLVSTGPLSPPLASYVVREQLEPRAPGVWVRRGGCRADPSR